MVHIEEVQKAATTNTKWKEKKSPISPVHSSSDKNKNEPCISHVWKVLIPSLPHLKYVLNVMETQAKKNLDNELSKQGKLYLIYILKND